MIRSVRRGLYDTKAPTFERASEGYSPDGTVVPAHYPRFTPGNYALEFDGYSESYAMFPGGDLLDQITNTLTIAAWILPHPRIENNGYVIAKNLSSVGNLQYGLHYNSTSEAVAIYVSGTQISRTIAGAVPKGIWTHVAVTWDGETITYFVNGEKSHSVNYDTPLVIVESPIYLGKRRDSIFYKGSVYSPSVYDRALSQQEIRDLMDGKIQNLTGLVWQPHFEGSGNIAYDTSGNGYHGTIHGATYTDHMPHPPYGRSILIEEGTENLVQNGNFASGLNGWTYPATRVEIVSGNFPFGNTAVRVRSVEGSATDFYQYIHFGEDIGGREFTLSFWGMRVSGVTISVQLRFRDENNNIILNEISTLEEGAVWKKYDKTVTAPPGTHTIQIIPRYSTASSEAESMLGDIQIEEKPYPTSFTVGTRAPEKLWIPATNDVLPQDEFQIDIDFVMLQHVWDRTQSSWSRLFQAQGIGTSADYLHVAFRSHVPHIAWELKERTNGSDSYHPGVDKNVTPPGPNRMTLKKVNGEFILFFNGNQEATLTAKNQSFERLYISGGTIGSGVTGVDLNCEYFGFRIRSRAMTDEQIAEEYEAGPLRPDQLTTYFLDFNGDLDTSQMVKRAPRWRGYSGVTM